LLLLLAVHSLPAVVAPRGSTRLLGHLPRQILEILQVVEARDALHSSHELLEVLAVAWHLLPVVVVGVLLLILVRSTSDSGLIVGDSRPVPPPLALPHLLVARIDKLLVLSLASTAHLLRALSGSNLLLPTVDMLLVTRAGLYVVQLLVDQVELGAVVVDIVLVVDMLAAIYYLLLDEIAAFAGQIVLADHVGTAAWSCHQRRPASAPRLLDVLVLRAHGELLLVDVFVLAVLIVVAVLIIILVLILIAIVVVLGDVFLARRLVILIDDSDLMTVVVVVVVERVLPRSWAVVVLLRGDVDLLLARGVVVPSLPTAAVVLDSLGCVICLAYEKVLLAEHVAQVLRLLPHRGLADRLRALLTGPGPLLLVLLPLSGVSAVVSTVASMASRTHRLSRIARPRLLLAIMELVADAEVIFSRVDHLLEPVVVAMHFHRVRNDGLNAIVVAHYLHGADDAKEWHVLTPRSLGEDLVVVACDDQGRDRVASSDLDRAVVAAEDHAVAWLHDRHGHAVVRDVDRVLVRGAVGGSSAHTLAHVVLAAHVLLVHASVALLLEVHIPCGHPGLVEGLAKMLLKICTNIKR
jgi:hypothetical protein